jgi:hypothetical protein
MKRLGIAQVTVVEELVCDRCSLVAAPEDFQFQEFTSIDHIGGYESIFGDGMKVQLDLCQSCVRDTLGTWLRVTDPRDKPDLNLSGLTPN